MTVQFRLSLAIATAVAVFAHAGRGQHNPLYLDFESEAFDNVPSYGNFHPKKGTGWYIKEHVHASSQGFAICDVHNVGAEIFKQLDSPLPGAKFRVLVRVFPMSGGTTNAVEVALGTRKDGTFTAADSAVLEWGAVKTRWYFWLGAELDPAAPCDVIRVKSVRAGRTGIGDNPEQPYPYIIFDHMVLTDDPAVTLEKDRKGLLTFEQPKGAKSAFVSEAGGRAAAFSEGLNAIRLPPVGPGNLLRNGGFELGVEPWWFAPDCFEPDFFITFDARDKKERKEGMYSLRIPLAYYERGTLKGFKGRIAHWPLVVKPGTGYTLSFYARSDREGATFGVDLYGTKDGKYSTLSWNDAWCGGRGPWRKRGSGKGEFTNGWQRYTVAFDTEADQEILYPELAFSADEQCTVWLDAVQIIEGDSDGYAQRVPVEAGVSWRTTAAVFYADRPLTFTLAVASHDDKATQAVAVDYEILNVRGTIEAKGRAEIDVRGPGTFEKEIRVSFGKRGSYLFSYTVAGRDEAPQIFAFCVVPDPGRVPNRMTEPFIGTIANLSEGSCRLHAALGHDILCTLEGSAFHPIVGRQNLHEDGEIVWRDEEVARCRRHGMDVWGYIVPWTWNRGKKLEWLSTYTTRLKGTEVMALDDYAEYCGRVLKHYDSVTRWTLEDEADMRWTADEFAPWMKRIYPIAKRANPKATVMFSVTPPMYEDIVKIIGDDYNDVIGGSFQGYSRWFYLYQRDVMQRLEKERFWNIGVGWTSRPTTALFDPFAGFRPDFSFRVAGSACSVVKNLVTQQAIVQPEIQSRYTSHHQWVHGWSFGPDNTFLSHSVAFVNILQFLRHGEAGGLLYPEQASLVQVCWFRKNGKPCVMVAPSVTFGDQVVQIDLNPREVEILDVNVNPVRVDGERLELALPANEVLLFLPAEGVAPERFLDAFRHMRSRQRVHARTLCLPGRDGLAMGVAIRNETGRSLEGLVTAGAKNLKHPKDNQRLVTIDSGQDVLIRFPLADVFGGERSFGAVNDPVTFTDGKTFYWNRSTGWKHGKGLWISKALPATGQRKVVVDGSVKEWVSQAGSYVYMTWALDGSYGRRQGRFEAHEVKNEADSSATIWSRYDEQHVYFALRVVDDDVRLAPDWARNGKAGDQVRLQLDTRLLGDLHTSDMNEDDYELVLAPDSKGHTAWLEHKDERTPLPARVRRTDEGWNAELSLPWTTLGGRRDVMGLNIRLIDADGGLGRTSELAWSGADYSPRDPRGFGQWIAVAP